MKNRKLRIAWSVVRGIVAVLLTVLWIRSYRQLDDELKYIDSNGRGWYLHSLHGGHLNWRFSLRTQIPQAANRVV